MARKQRRQSSRADAGAAFGASSGDAILAAATLLAESEALRKSGDLQKAKRICEGLLKQHPDYVGALHTLGNVFFDLQQYEKAYPHLINAMTIAPGDWRIMTLFGRVNMQMARVPAALDILNKALVIAPGETAILNTLGEIYRHQNEFARAAEIYEQLSRQDPAAPLPRLALASCYEELGQFEKVATLCEKLTQEGFASLALITLMGQLPTSLVSRDLLVLLDRLRAQNRQEEEEMKSVRALLLHRAGHHEQAWAQMVEANGPRVKKALTSWSAGARQRVALIEQTRAAPNAAGMSETPNGLPISLFIVGPPRAGKTTLEQLLQVVPGLSAGYESQILEEALRRTLQMSRLLTRPNLAELPEELEGDFLKTYNEILNERAKDATVFTNGYPGLVVDVLRLAKIIPGARFVFVKRDMDDLVVRAYLKNYSDGAIAYAQDIGSIQEHLTWFNTMVELSAERLPNAACVISYEEMIDDPVKAVSMVAELCGLTVDETAVVAPGDDRGVSAPYKSHLAKAQTE